MKRERLCISILKRWVNYCPLKGDFIKITKEKEVKIKIDKTIQKGITNTW